MINGRRNRRVETINRWVETINRRVETINRRVETINRRVETFTVKPCLVVYNRAGLAVPWGLAPVGKIPNRVGFAPKP